MKHACSMLSALTIYESEFEQPFLKETSDFYMTVGQELLQSNSASEYIIRVFFLFISLMLFVPHSCTELT